MDAAAAAESGLVDYERIIKEHACRCLDLNQRSFVFKLAKPLSSSQAWDFTRSLPLSWKAKTTDYRVDCTFNVDSEDNVKKIRCSVISYDKVSVRLARALCPVVASFFTVAFLVVLFVRAFQ